LYPVSFKSCKDTKIEEVFSFFYLLLRPFVLYMDFLACIFIIALGCLGHFIFEWSGHRTFFGLFFAVNESTWEHIKLAIYPSFLWMIVEVCINGWSKSILIAQFCSLAVMMLLIPGLFYGYTAITRKNWLIPDIICFCVAVVAGIWVRRLVLNAAPDSLCLFIIALAGCAVILAMYFTFSYRPPHCFLFRDPISSGFGPKGHGCHSHFHHV